MKGLLKATAIWEDEKMQTNIFIQLSSPYMIESCCAVTSYYCLKCVHVFHLCLLHKGKLELQKLKFTAGHLIELKLKF